MITLVKNDYGTPLMLHAESNNKVIPLVGSEVYFDLVSKATNKRVGGGKCEVTDDMMPLGMAKYTFKDPELAHEGEYWGRFRIELAQGAKRDGVQHDIKVVDVPLN